VIRICLVLGLACLPWRAQAFQAAPDPAQDLLDRAYKALGAKDYERAIQSFLEALALAPDRPNVRKDLAYTYLKVGEPVAARDQFGEAMRLDPNDVHVALEYAFLCYETKERARARRIFDQIRKTGPPEARATAEQAFRNIDRALEEGISRWSEAAARTPDNFSAHHELATLAEERDELALAEKHYREAWRVRPDLRSLLLDIGRVWKAQGRVEEANAALLAASRGAEPRVAEAARELLPKRYPYLNEFRKALELDPKNTELRREMAYFLLQLGRKDEAEQEFRKITANGASDLLSVAQVGFLKLGENDVEGALPYLERVLSGTDQKLAEKVRAALNLPPELPPQAPASASGGGPVEPSDVRAMAFKSYEAGYLQDALRYLQQAHSNDPLDFEVMLKLGWAYNMAKEDDLAVRWFALARRSPQAEVAREASRAYKNLRPTQRPYQFAMWLYPMYSSRWESGFGYGQFKTEFKFKGIPVYPYVSLRLVGDTKGVAGGPLPQYLSESSIIVGGGIRTDYWHGLMLWAEAGSAISYLDRRRQDTGAALPDYRGGVAWSKGFGHLLGGESAGGFFETNADGVFISRFDNDFLMYWQNRAGYTAPVIEALGGLQIQLLMHMNLTADFRRFYWANFGEIGPGCQFRWKGWPGPLRFTVSYLHGVYTRKEGNPRGPTFNDLRIGMWYAFTR